MRIRNELKDGHSSILRAYYSASVKNFGKIKFVRGNGLIPRVCVFTEYGVLELDGFSWGTENEYTRHLSKLLLSCGAADSTANFICKVQTGCDWAYFPKQKHVKVGVDVGFRITYNACERFYRK